MTCQASDVAGNTAARSVGYQVTNAFLGYASPLPKESLKAGSKVPAKFALGVYGGGATRVTTATMRAVLAPLATATFDQGASVACPYDAKAKLFVCSLKTSAVVGTANANGESIVVRSGRDPPRTLVAAPTLTP